ncbi:MAG: ribbon-helix-helix protein, CopG family [Actinobacteria bacterium]|jgi:predicted HicB family RNase H-like nuclease|nr:ribbon-helix-helix protein, CopG family [Actinomycetota bacterium]
MPRNYRIGSDVDLDNEVVLDSRGSRITEERAVRIAQETLARAGRGRPALAEGKARSPQVSFRVPADLKVRAEERAVHEHKSMSQLVREALEQLLAS